MTNKARQWPWLRHVTNFRLHDHNYPVDYTMDYPKFSKKYFGNRYLDIFTKRAALKAAPSVVSLVARLGNKQISQCSGIIIESDGTILTSANLTRCPEKKNCVPENIKFRVFLCNGRSYKAKLTAHDFYFNIAVLKIRADTSHLMASLRCVDDSADSSDGPLRPHSNLFRLAPGEKIIALGRYFIQPFDLMVAPGEFSIDCCEDYGCKEMFRATCLITQPGEGGPLVNRYGEVIGISTIDAHCFTPFLPMNIILRWWDHYKRCKEMLPPPELGMEFTNLFYAIGLEDMEKVIKKFSVSTGVIVEAVKPGSCADSAGIRSNDLIVKCCGKHVRSFLQLFDMMWEKLGSSVELVVLRVGDDDAPQRVNVVCSITPRSSRLDCDDDIDDFVRAGEFDDMDIDDMDIDDFYK